MIVEEFDEHDGLEMSEGEIAECLTGTYGTIVCPKCGYSEEFEI
jgi:predicted nucleic-acid-binding Zn-ribbon protein